VVTPRTLCPFEIVFFAPARGASELEAVCHRVHHQDQLARIESMPAKFLQRLVNLNEFSVQSLPHFR
jgi:hypothetical protein